MCLLLHDESHGGTTQACNPISGLLFQLVSEHKQAQQYWLATTYVYMCMYMYM